MSQQKLIQTPNDPNQTHYQVVINAAGMGELVHAGVLTAEQVFNMLFRQQIPDTFLGSKTHAPVPACDGAHEVHDCALHE